VEVPAVAAQARELRDQPLRGHVAERADAPPPAEDSVDAGAGAARIEPVAGERHSARERDRAPAREVCVCVLRKILWRNVVCVEVILSWRALARIPHRHPGRDAREDPTDFRPVPVRDQLDDDVRKPAAVSVDFVEDLEEPGMKGRLSPEQRDLSPAPVEVERLVDEPSDLLHRHQLGRDGLSARTVAVVTLEIAGSCELELDLREHALEQRAPLWFVPGEEPFLKGCSRHSCSLSTVEHTTVGAAFSHASEGWPCDDPERVTPDVEQVRTYARSLAWGRRAQTTDAWAAARPILEHDARGSGYPRYVSRAKGAYVWDVDGNRHVDYILGFGPVVLGHADARVDRAVLEQLELGTCMSPLWSPRQVELTELLTSVIPSAEKVYLMRTGSDATSAAVRLARIYTGRTMIVRWGYNGWHDWAVPRPDGIPSAIRAETLLLDYNDTPALRTLFETYPEQIACVLMMPFELEAPAPGFLQDVEAVARDHGALFILDELRSGFRMGLGGAQDYFGLTPDLSTFGKAMANGYPISAVVGRADVLRCLGRTHMASTSYGNAAEMAAALATIAILRDSDAIDRLWHVGETFMAELRTVVEAFDLPAEVVGYPVAPFLQFDRAVEGSLEVKTRFFSATTRGGVLFHPDHHWFLSAAHTDDDVAFTIEVCRQAAASAMAA
jgi:glutamate-1-semialdehyde 2,1-aminomutase